MICLWSFGVVSLGLLLQTISGQENGGALCLTTESLSLTLVNITGPNNFTKYTHVCV